MAEDDDELTTRKKTSLEESVDLPSKLDPVDMDMVQLKNVDHGYKRHLIFTINNFSINDAFTESVSRSDITCFRCGERGHKKQECRTWKTKPCRNQSCELSINCPFAHSDEALRTPWVARCIRVIRENGQLRSIGCGCTGHTFRECPVYCNTAINTTTRVQTPQAEQKDDAHLVPQASCWDRRPPSILFDTCQVIKT